MIHLCAIVRSLQREIKLTPLPSRAEICQMWVMLQRHSWIGPAWGIT